MSNADDNTNPHSPGMLSRGVTHVIDMLIPEPGDKRERGRWVERKLQSFLLTLMLLAVLWAAGKIALIDSINDKIATMQVQLDGTYRADVATRDMQDLRRRIDLGDVRDREYDQRLDTAERRIDRIEYVLDTAPVTKPLLRRAQKAAAIDAPKGDE